MGSRFLVGPRDRDEDVVTGHRHSLIAIDRFSDGFPRLEPAPQESSALEKIIHATAWGPFLYGMVGEQLFESAVAREIRGIRLRRDF